MSDYGCCTLSECIHEDDYKSCDDCPFYDKDFFRVTNERARYIFEFARTTQCVECKNSPEHCGCTETDKWPNGICKRWEGYNE